MSSPKKVKSNSQQSGKSSEGIGPVQYIDFTSKSRWTDLQLKVENKDLYVPKSHLALVSPVFRMMFESGFKEKDLDVLPLPGKKYEDVLAFLKCTHPGALEKVTYDVVPKVLPLAHEYQVKWLLDDCSNVMMMEMDSSKVSSTNINGFSFATALVGCCSTNDLARKYCSICVMAEKYSLGSVIDKFIQKLSSMCYRYYKDLIEFKQVSAEVRYRVVCGRLDSTDKNL